MKRYGKILAVCLVTLLTISTFYIQSSMAGNKDFEIEFKKVSGDDQELNKIKLNGHYVYKNIYHYLEISKEEMVHLNSSSLFQRFIMLSTTTRIRELISQYRSFMRGNELIDVFYFEDKKYLVYANINNKNENLLQGKPGDFFFDIKVLNKNSGEINTIQLDVPGKEKYEWIFVYEVQVIDNQLKVIAKCYGNKGNNEIRVFSFNMNPLKLTDNKIIVSAPEGENSDVGILNDAFSMKPEKYLLIKKDRYEGDMAQETRNREIMAYNMATNKLMKLDVPEELSGGIEGSQIINSILYLETYTGDRVEVNRFDLEKGEWLEKLSFALKLNQDDLNHVFTQIKNGKLFIIQLENNDYLFSIKDLHSGKSLYEGKLIVKKQNEIVKDYKLYFDNIEVLD